MDTEQHGHDHHFTPNQHTEVPSFEAWFAFLQDTIDLSKGREGGESRTIFQVVRSKLAEFAYHFLQQNYF